jgi:alkanesulfonate monooxygenase SsuD/methylene tetrahydromethanopterin reductase-like flavin-dependent oxidoreductase (luciferase family)
MALTFGIHIGHMGGPLPEMRKLWRFADQMGFDWFSVSDHFQESPPQGGGLPCFEGVTTLTAAALETTRVKLGSLVFCLGYRTPGLLAKSLTTIDHLSGGRVNCGIGAGWHAIEFQAYGIPFPSIGVREDQLEEYAQVLRLLLDPAVERAQFEGTHFRLEDAPNIPKPLQPHVPIWIGGQGEKRTLRAVARYADGWNAPYISPDVWSAKSRVLDGWCEKERRDPRAIARTVNVGFYLGADARAAARHEEVFQQHWKNDPRRGFLRGTPKDALELIAAYRDAGVERMNIAFRQGPYDWDALQAFVETVFPAFGITRPE